METLNEFHYSYMLANQLYGTEINEIDFEEIALIAWNLIGNKRTRIYRTILDVNSDDNSAELPCNVDIIDAVTMCGEDYQYTTNYTEFDNYDSRFTENYIESRKFNRHPLYASGGFVKYHQSGNLIFLDNYIRKIKVLYRGVELDDTGLPKITDKEALALATYVSYITAYKKGILTQNRDTIQIAGMLKQEWEKKCDAARVKSSVWSQNDMDMILDSKTSWNRKMFGKSYKPFK